LSSATTVSGFFGEVSDLDLVRLLGETDNSRPESVLRYEDEH